MDNSSNMYKFPSLIHGISNTSQYTPSFVLDTDTDSQHRTKNKCRKYGHLPSSPVKNKSWYKMYLVQ